MATRLIAGDHWSELTNAVRASRRPCKVAVAYFGQGASGMLPLPGGSRLVVDASERCVKQGMTCPDELIRLSESGVEIYSVPNLHAKVYVIGQGVYVGSANVSGHSATGLVEALLYTGEQSAVAEAGKFVDGLCLDRLLLVRLRKLARLYRSPRFEGGRSPVTRNGPDIPKPEVPEVRIARLSISSPWPDDEAEVRGEGDLAASKLRQHDGDSHRLDKFRWAGRSAFNEGQWVIQVVKKNGTDRVYPPGYVVKVTKVRSKKAVYVHFEIPAKRGARSLEKLRELLSDPKALSRSGRLSDEQARMVLEIWNR